MREKVAKFAYHHAKENKVTLHPFIKNHFRSLFLVLLFLLGTLLVFFSVAGLFVLPILWCIFACSHRFSEKPVIVFFDKAFQISVGLYFASLLFMLIYTPEWVKKISIYLERYSFFTIFSTGSFMYGRLFVSFLLFSLVFIGFIVIYRRRIPAQI